MVCSRQWVCSLHYSPFVQNLSQRKRCCGESLITAYSVTTITPSDYSPAVRSCFQFWCVYHHHRLLRYIKRTHKQPPDAHDTIARAFVSTGWSKKRHKVNDTIILQPYVIESCGFQQNVPKKILNVTKVSIWIQQLNIFIIAAGNWTMQKQYYPWHCGP